MQSTTLDRLYTRWWIWCNRWTRSQIIFLLVVAMIPSIAALYAAHRFVKAQEAAYYWQEKAVQNLTP